MWLARVFSIGYISMSIAVISGCDDGSGKKVDITGDWLRTRTLHVGNRTEVDTWKFTFREDGTFTEFHETTNDLDDEPFTPCEGREGTYKVNSDGTITLTGQWLDMSSGEMDSLAELSENLYSYSRQVMLIMARDGDLMFIGPDVLTFTSWPYSQSYNLLYNDPENNTLSRQFEIQLTNADGEVVENRVESFQFQVTSTGCVGQYSLTEVLSGSDEQSNGQFTECAYEITDSVSVEDVDGAMVQVQAVTFTYSADGLSDDEQEYYIKVGDHYLGYNPSEQETAIRNSAFVRVE